MPHSLSFLLNFVDYASVDDDNDKSIPSILFTILYYSEQVNKFQSNGSNELGADYISALGDGA